VTVTRKTKPESARRDDVVRLAGQLFAEKGYRGTTVREIADAAGILSGSLYHHFDSKESIGDEILAGFLDQVRADYEDALSSGGDPRSVLEQIVRTTSKTLATNRTALSMLRNDWTYFNTHPRFGYLRNALREFEQAWISQLERGVAGGAFRPDLDSRLTYRLLRDVLWIPAAWHRSGGYSTDQVVDAFLALLFDGITADGHS
jgi:AcrR family transcriptional regulator